MGYNTEFDGRIEVNPPLNEAERDYLRKFAETRRMDRDNGPYFVDGTGDYGQNHDADVREFNKPPAGQPGLWCQWKPSDCGRFIEWDMVEKFYDADEWMKYIIDHFLRPDAHAQGQEGFEDFTFDHICNGDIVAQGEEYDDRWLLRVRNNEVTTHVAIIT